MQQTDASKKISLMITIVNRELSDQVASLLNSAGVHMNIRLPARGTADSAMLDYLGLGETEKDILLSGTSAACVPALLQTLKKELPLDKTGAGIAFCIPISSVCGPVTLKYLQGASAKKEGEVPMNDKRCELIITIVDRGFSDLVMEEAKNCGATGGTVLNARGTGAHEEEKFFGITITPEKEVVLILIDTAHKAPIMQAISRRVGLNNPGHGISFSLPVDGVAGNQQLEALFTQS